MVGEHWNWSHVEMMFACGLDLAGTKQCLRAGFRKLGDEAWCSMKGEKLLDQLKSCQFHKKNSPACSSTLMKVIRVRNYQGHREQDKGNWSIVCGYCTPGDRNSYINIRCVALPPLTRPPVDLADGTDRIACVVLWLLRDGPAQTCAVLHQSLSGSNTSSQGVQ